MFYPENEDYRAQTVAAAARDPQITMSRACQTLAVAVSADSE